MILYLQKNLKFKILKKIKNQSFTGFFHLLQLSLKFCLKSLKVIQYNKYKNSAKNKSIYRDKEKNECKNSAKIKCKNSVKKVQK